VFVHRSATKIPPPKTRAGTDRNPCRFFQNHNSSPPNTSPRPAGLVIEKILPIEKVVVFYDTFIRNLVDPLAHWHTD